jgi:dihydrofolate reductase
MANMRTIMFMAITANGFIARKNGFSDFVSADALEDNIRMVKKAGCCVMGRKTYEYILKYEDFPLPCYNVVMTKKKLRSRWKNVLFTNGEPKEVLKHLKKEGFKTILLFGGAKANSSFLKEDLVDECYLYVVPVAFGAGIKLLQEMDLEAKLNLLKIDRFSEGTIGLHYKVIKVAKKIKIHS